MYSLGAGARKSLVLFWTALFVCSLLLQYVVAASPVLAVHDEGLFELDGNAVNDPAVAGDDWDQVYAGTSNASSTKFITDLVDNQGDDTFTGGSTKDDQPLSAWLWKFAKASQAKNDITHAFAAAYTKPIDGNIHTIVYFGMNKYEASGDNYVGFWFFKNAVGTTGNGVEPGSPFTGAHAVGDILVLADYTNGGGIASFSIYQWVGSGGNANAAGTLQVVASGVPCTGGPGSDTACGATNATTVPAPWPYQGNGPQTPPNVFPPGTLFEGGIDLTALGLDTGCYSSFLAETRASQSVDATLSDFAGGTFSFCKPPTIDTQVMKDGNSLGNLGTVNMGDSVTDHATLTGDKGTVEGTVDFSVCGPDANGAPDCSTGGTKVGGTKTLSGGQADSDAFKPTQTGYYCFRVDYTPAAGSKYLAASHTNTTTECFRVQPAHIALTKTPDAASVSAGSQIGFTLSITSTGPGTAYGVKVSDTLPTNAGLNWAIDPAGTTGDWSISSGILSFGGGSGATMASGAEYHVHITSPTTAATCGKVDNTGNATTTNDGSDSASASVTVLCPDIQVTKTPDGANINRGDTATFSIEVKNIGQGTATGVTLHDPLPAGVNWTTSDAGCSISGAVGSQVLDCNVGTLAAGASKTYTVSGPTTNATACGVLNNTASASATNEPSNVLGNNSDSGSINVECAQIDIAKTADNGTVNAGDQIGFTITVTNNGAGTAYNVSATDSLDPAFSWSLAQDVTGWSLNGNTLTYTAASLASGASSSVDVVATSTAADCGVVNNTASVTTGNDGSDQASASVTIQCPDIHVAKTADPAGPVSAGDQIGFDVTISNSGPGAAYGAQATDNLPGTGWSILGAANGWSLNGSTLSYGPATLAAGASATVHVVRLSTPAECGVVPNTVTGFATNEPADSQPNTANASVTVMCPDVTVVKSAVNTPVSAGDPIAFDITVSNSGAAGTGTAYNVTLTDPLPGGGITWTENSNACSISGTGDNQVLNCSWTSLTPGASATVRVSGITSAANCGSVPNTATVAAANEPESNTGNNSDDATVVVQCPDIHVSKTADNSPISAGEKASFTITVTNDGLGQAKDVVLTDTLPAGITWVADNEACSIAAGVLTCNVGTLDAGASFTVKISGETTAANCGTIPNTASATASNESAADATDNSGSASIQVNCPLIVITKTADKPEVNATDQIGFVITVTNTGDGSAFGVTVDDLLPTNSGLGWSIDQAGSDSGWTIDAGHLKYGPATLASKASVSVHIVSGTTPATCGTVNNSASVDYTGGSGEDSSTVAVDCPDIVLTKTADNSPILAGQIASYTITVSNQGSGTAYDVVVTDNLPAGITWSVDNKACSIANGVLTCKLGDIAADADPILIVVSGQTSAANCGNLPNQATATAANEAESDTDNNTGDATIVVQCASISLVKTAGSAADGAVFVTEPGNVTFTYLVKNTGTAALMNISLVDDNATPADTSDDITVICPATALAAGASMTCTATLPVGFGLRTNVAVVTANPVLDTKGKVSATDDAVVRVPQLLIQKAITAGVVNGAPIVEGNQVTYTLTYTLSNGPVTNGVITDVLPDGLTYVTGSATNNDEFTFQSYDSATRTLKWVAANVTKGGSVSYQATAATGSSSLPQPLVNTATIKSDQTAPNSATASVIVGKVEELTPPPTSTIDQPTQSSTGNGLLLLLVAISGFMLLASLLAPAPARARKRNRRS